MGHRLEVNVPVDDTLVQKENMRREEASETSLSRYEKALMGMSIIFGLFGCLLGWKGYKKLKQG